LQLRLEIREYGLGDTVRRLLDYLYQQKLINFDDKLRSLGLYSLLAD
jgi:hypothetical protein